MNRKIDGYGKLRVYDAVISEIKDRCAPDDVFDEDELIYWASFNKKPDEIFINGELDEWAKENGYTKDEQ